ncbi:benzoate 4-monooxygenase cytochrome-like protein P450 [Byssothecium circinans]|uniref:Benzoate 4-monooxygenase cytochrome-like protein P450 n=1 Tax=Byssothecium circinans TaxID=147558 RepID=A0A6A5TJ34_9PLEO|nr:benzoate 4-monooxygenase cytochrome-like protein P450 [Byssothecium circinans]
MHNIIALVFDYAVFCVLALFAFTLLKALYNLTLHPLHSYPGPLHWRASRLPWAHSMQSGRLHADLHKLHQTYGPVVRIAPDELSYTDPQAWHDIYQPRSSSHAVFEKTAKWVKPQPNDPHSLMSVDEKAHTRHRRALTGAFTEHAVGENAGMLECYVDLMVSKFRELAAVQGTEDKKNTAIINIVDWLNYLTFDISGHLSFGESFSSLANGKPHPWVEISCTFGKGLALMATVNFFSPLDKLLAFTIPASIKAKMVFHRELVHQKMHQRLGMPEKKGARDFVGSVLRYNEEKGETKVPVPMEELEADLSVLIFAGSETTGTALTGVITALLRNAEVMERAVGEVRTVFAAEEDITIANIGRLEYVDAVVKEALRLGPPAAVGLPRVVPKGGEVVCGRYVPGGTLVSLNQYPAFRSPSNFTHPSSFIPERFLPSTPFPDDNISVFEPFLVGRHKCMGQKLAWAEMRLVLARLLWAFDLKAVDEVKDFGEQKTFMFWHKEDLRVELRERDG